MQANLNVGSNNVLIGDFSGGGGNLSTICIKQDGQISNTAASSIYGLKFYNSISNDGYYMGYTIDGYFGIFKQTNAATYQKLIDIGSDSTFLYKPLTMSGNIITGLSLPISYNDAATKGYVDTLAPSVATGGGLSIAPASILSIQLDPSLDNDLSLSSSGLLGSGLKTDGTSQMTGNLNMNSNKITNLLTPTIRTDAATKGYVDSSIATIMTNVDMNSNQIFNLADPVDPHDAVTKEYVDNKAITVAPSGEIGRASCRERV